MLIEDVRAPHRAPLLGPAPRSLGTDLAPRALAEPAATVSAVPTVLALEPTRGDVYAYDSEVAYLSAMASGWAYATAGDLAAVMARTGMPDNYCHRIHVENDPMLVTASAFFLRSQCGRLGILAFRGTELANLVNWLTDACVHPVPYPPLGHVHSGFYNNVEVIWDDIRAELLRALAPRKNGDEAAPAERASDEDPPHALEALYLTGHSLGGAMACLAATNIFFDPALQDLRRVLRGVYTFGQPMLGDPAFARLCGERFGAMVFRHIYHRDLVPTFPPRSTGHFEHFGRELEAKPQEAWSFRDKATEQNWSALLTGSVGVVASIAEQLLLLKRLPFHAAWIDHVPLHYIQCSARAVGIAA